MDQDTFVCVRKRRVRRLPVKDRYHTGGGAKKGRLSQWGGLMAAAMRSVTAGSAWRCGASLMTDISRQTVVRWEKTASACDALMTRDFYTDMESRMRAPASRDFQYSCHSIRSDATNAKVLHKEAIHVLIIYKL